MEPMDPNGEQQIWQRVFAAPAQRATDNLDVLQQLSAQTAADYRYLTEKTTGKVKEQLRHLLEEEQAVYACLSGIRILSGVEENRRHQTKASPEPTVRILQRCYHRCRRCMVELAAREIDSEFGVVFRNLATREEAACVRIAEMLGRLNRR